MLCKHNLIIIIYLSGRNYMLLPSQRPGEGANLHEEGYTLQGWALHDHNIAILCRLNSNGNSTKRKIVNIPFAP